MSAEDGKPAHLAWNYSRAELLADGLVHAFGIVLAICGAICLLLLCLRWTSGFHAASATIYALCLVAALAISAAYNMWPVSRTKWLLRRFDHACIYLLIAGTYTPILALVPQDAVPGLLLPAVWIVATIGIALKLALPGQFDRLSILLYLALGWSGLFVAHHVVSALSVNALCLIGAGGVLYSAGIIFHVWERLRFQNVIWHGFVLVAAGCHYWAVLDCLVLERS